MLFGRRIYCLMVSGIPFDDMILGVLFRAARDMLRNGAERRVIRTDDVEGVVETRFHTAVLGSLTGIVFQAEIETDAGLTKTRFIVDSAEIPDEYFERSEWSEWSEHPRIARPLQLKFREWRSLSRPLRFAGAVFFCVGLTFGVAAATNGLVRFGGRFSNNTTTKGESMSELREFTEFAIETARGAGTILKRHHRRSHNLEWKLINNFKTSVDDKSDRFIRAAIERKFPDHGILSEEDDPKAARSEYTWVVDPLDGTIPYTRGISDHFSVCIALCRGRTPIVGVIFCPLRNPVIGGELYSAGLAGSARCNGEMIQVNLDSDVHHAIVGLDPGKAPGRTRLPLEVEARLVGDDGVLCVSQHICASVSLALVASGKMNAYAATRLEPWDMAAAVVICREAGARVTDLAGKEWELGDESILVANPVLHQKILTMLEP